LLQPNNQHPAAPTQDPTQQSPPFQELRLPFRQIITAMLPFALNVLDRFHIAKKLGEAVGEVRRQEAKKLATEGCEP